jgi:hypothetical protein
MSITRLAHGRARLSVEGIARYDWLRRDGVLVGAKPERTANTRRTPTRR